MLSSTDGPLYASDEAKKALIGLARDLRGLAFAFNTKTSYMMLFDWMYPLCIETKYLSIHFVGIFNTYSYGFITIIFVFSTLEFECESMVSPKDSTLLLLHFTLLLLRCYNFLNEKTQLSELHANTSKGDRTLVPRPASYDSRPEIIRGTSPK